MKTVTNEFKEQITKLGREIDFKIFLYANNKIITENSNFLITEDNKNLVVQQFNEQEIAETITSEDIYNVSIVNQGKILSTMMKEVDFEVKQNLKIGDVVSCQFGLKVGEEYEYIDYGKYMIYSKEFNEDTKSYSYVAFDRMLLTMKEASKDFLTSLEGQTLAFTIHKICEDTGLSYTATQEELTEYPNLNKTINEGTFTDMQITYRDILDMICQALGLSMIVEEKQLILKKFDKQSKEQVTTTGTNELIINDVIQGNATNYTVNGKCEQNGTPTPSVPIDIETLPSSSNLGIKIENSDRTQEQNILIDLSKPNLFDINEEPSSLIRTVVTVENNELTVTITTESRYTSYATIPIPNSDNLLGKTVTLSANMSTDGGSTRMRLYTINANGSPVGSLGTLNESGSITITLPNTYPTNVVGFGLTFYPARSAASVGTSSTYSNVYLLEGNDTTPYYELCKVGNYKDTLSINSNGNCIINKNVGKIVSYNGETITTDYISTTGELSTGATIYYGLTTQETINLTNTTITLYEGTNYITLKDDLETTTSITYNKISSDIEEIDEQFIKDTNVSFGEKYMINSVVLSRSEDTDNIYRRDEESIAKYGVHEFKIKDNLIMLYDDREDYIDEIFEQLNGLEYYINDYSSTGITYLDWLDFYNVKIGDKTYKCLMLNDEININQGLEENIYAEEPEETVTDYKTSSKTDKEVSFIVDKQNGRIKAKVSQDDIIASLNVAIEDGQGIVELKGNTVTIDSDYFTLDENGRIESTSGKIGGFQLETDKFTTQVVSEKLARYTYTSSDLTRVRNIINGSIAPTVNDYDKYDFDFNGKITGTDYVITGQIINGTITGRGTFSLNSFYSEKSLVLSTNDGDERVRLGIFGSYIHNLAVNNLYCRYGMETDNAFTVNKENGEQAVFVGLGEIDGVTDGQITVGDNIYLMGSNGEIICSYLTQTSLAENKNDFELLKSGLDIIKNIDIYKYHLKTQKNEDKKHIGFVIGDNYKYSQELTSNENDGVDIYSFVSVCCKAIQEQQEIIDDLKSRIEILEKESDK